MGEKPKRIIIFSLAYDPFIGGAEVAVKEITNRLNLFSYEFDMVTVRFDSRLPLYEKIGNIHVHRVGLFSKRNPSPNDLVRLPLKLDKYLFPILGLLKARRLHMKKPYDATWAIMANLAGAAAMFFKIAFPKIPMVLTLQEGDSDAHVKGRVGLFFPLWKQIFLKANIIQVISSYLKSWAESFGFKGQIEIVPNGVDFKRFGEEYSKIEMEELKRQLKKNEGNTLLVTTSRLVKKNGVDDIIRSLQFLPESVRLLVIGDGPLRSELEALVERGALSNRVVFLGEISHRDIPKYLRATDIFVRPSRSEGMGISFIEAMAAGIPVIATPIGGIVDFLFDPEKSPENRPTGLFCKVDNPESIAQAVKRLIEDSVLRTKLTENALIMVHNSYDWSRVADLMEKEVFAKIFQHA